MEKIPLNDLKAQYESIKGEIDKAIADVIENSTFIKGPQIEAFERSFASYCNAKYCISTGSGTSALYLALIAAGIKTGDEVITVPNTFIATTEAISATGAKIKFVDVDDYYLIDIEKLKEAITPKTKAILPVHLHGLQADMDEILEIAEEKNLIVVEDAAQAHGAEYEGKRSPINKEDGNEIAIYSFFPAKNLGAMGDAGAVVTNNEEIAEKVRLLRDHGRISKYEHLIEGFNQRMDSIQAAVLNVKLKHLDNWIEKRRRIASLYNKFLAEVNSVSLPSEKAGRKHAYHLYVIKTKERDNLQKYLEQVGIQTGIHYPIPLHLQKAYSYLNHKEGSFPVAEKQAKEILSLPIYPELSEEKVAYICDKIKEFFKTE